MVLAGRSPDKLKALGAELGCDVIEVDATNSAQVDAAFAHIVKSCGSPAGVAHCVGSLLLKSAGLTSDGEWTSVIATNLTSAFYVLRAAGRVMTASGGSIVLVSSAAARIGLANHEGIAAAKAGVQGLMLAAAATLSRRGIRVNCVAPGLTRTPMTAALTANEVMLKASTSFHALGRIGEPDEVAAAICWLLDPAQSWITGQTLGVDGGLGTVVAR